MRGQKIEADSSHGAVRNDKSFGAVRNDKSFGAVRNDKSKKRSQSRKLAGVWFFLSHVSKARHGAPGFFVAWSEFEVNVKSLKQIPHMVPFGMTNHLVPFGMTSHLVPFGMTSQKKSAFKSKVKVVKRILVLARRLLRGWIRICRGRRCGARSGRCRRGLRGGSSGGRGRSRRTR
jgi:hypothetical protein